MTDHHFYRKVWIDHNGPISLDEEGRTYEIHHIDGDRRNNDPSNLIALSIKDHYDIHYKQGDWGACHRIAIKMKLSPETISENARRAAQKRVDDGNHHFVGGSIQRNAMNKRVQAGTHNFLGGGIQRKRVDEGTHHLLSGQIQRKQQQRRLSEGIHNFQRQPNPNEDIVTCPHCGKSGAKPGMKRWHFDKCKQNGD